MTFSEAMNKNKNTIDTNNLSVDQLKALKRSTLSQKRNNTGQNNQQNNTGQNQNQNQGQNNTGQNNQQKNKDIDVNTIDKIIRDKRMKKTRISGLQKRIDQIKNS